MSQSPILLLSDFGYYFSAQITTHLHEQWKKNVYFYLSIMDILCNFKLKYANKIYEKRSLVTKKVKPLLQLHYVFSLLCVGYWPTQMKEHATQIILPIITLCFPIKTK